jgi:hypothetical protein
MIRKTLIAIATAATLTLGLGAATAPAEAGVRIYLGTPYAGYYGDRYYGRRYYGHRYYGHRHRHCHRVRVYTDYGYKRVKRCHSHRHSGGHHY